MNRSSRILGAAVVCVFALAACGDDSAGDGDAAVDEGAHDSDAASEEEGEIELPEVECSGADVPGYDEVAAFDVCTNCHSSELTGDARNDAPPEYNFDTHEDAADEAEEIAHEVFEGEMPPAGSGFSLSQAEKDELYLWALCGAPE
jgi:uncharacterized membrane protein